MSQRINMQGFVPITQIATIAKAAREKGVLQKAQYSRLVQICFETCCRALERDGGTPFATEAEAMTYLKSLGFSTDQLRTQMSIGGDLGLTDLWPEEEQQVDELTEDILEQLAKGGEQNVVE